MTSYRRLLRIVLALTMVLSLLAGPLSVSALADDVILG